MFRLEAFEVVHSRSPRQAQRRTGLAQHVLAKGGGGVHGAGLISLFFSLQSMESFKDQWQQPHGEERFQSV